MLIWTLGLFFNDKIDSIFYYKSVLLCIITITDKSDIDIHNKSIPSEKFVAHHYPILHKI